MSWILPLCRRRPRPLSSLRSWPSKMIEPEFGVLQAHDEAADGGLAAAGLAHHAERLAPRHLEADVGHRADAADPALHDGARGDREFLDQVLDRQQRPVGRRAVRRGRGSEDREGSLGCLGFRLRLGRRHGGRVRVLGGRVEGGLAHREEAAVLVQRDVARQTGLRFPARVLRVPAPRREPAAGGGSVRSGGWPGMLYSRLATPTGSDDLVRQRLEQRLACRGAGGWRTGSSCRSSRRPCPRT